jgi:IS30 family transposase
MAAVIATERRLRTRTPGRELVVQNIVNLATNPRLRRAVAGKLRLDWSPEQIAGWLKRTYPEDECNQVSHETIYRSLFVQTRGVLKKELLVIFDRSARCVAPSRLIRTAIDGGISRISSQSVSDRRRLKIGRCLAIGKAICCHSVRDA